MINILLCRLVSHFLKVYEFMIPVLFLWTLSSECGALLMLEIEVIECVQSKTKFISIYFQFQLNDDIELDGVLRFMVLLLWTNLTIFIFCECGQRVTNKFTEVNDIICQLNWYLFSIEIQRMMPNIMMITQRPVILRGFGNCYCTREAFKNVSFTVISILISYWHFHRK